MMVISSVMSMQHREGQALTEKLAAMDFQQQLIRVFTDTAFCTALLTGANFSFTVPSGSAVPNNPLTVALPIASIPNLIAPGGQISPISSTLRAATANTFQLTNIVGTNNGATGTYNGSVTVNFDQTNLMRALKPVSAQITMSVATSGATQTVTKCGATVPSPFAGCHSVVVSSPTFGNHQIAEAYCPAGENFIAGNSQCESPNGLMFSVQGGPVNGGWRAECYYAGNPGGNCCGPNVTSAAVATAFCCP